MTEFEELRLFVPAEDHTWSQSIQTERELQICKDIASRLGLAIRLDKATKKLFLGRKKNEPTPTPVLATAAVTYPSGKSYEKAKSSDAYRVTGAYEAAVLFEPSPDDKLSENFTAGEFMPRDSSYSLLRISPKLVSLLEKVRARLGPVRITSGYRPPAYNASVGGVSNSAHIDGLATDIYVEGVATSRLYEVCDSVVGDSGGVGFYPTQGFVHIDVRGYRSRWKG